MVLCCPSATLGGHVWWNILSQDQYFVVQQHKIGKIIIDMTLCFASKPHIENAIYCGKY
jgi:hypothetical protein